MEPGRRHQNFANNDGNPLGLAGQGPLNLSNADITWTNEVDDARILAGAESMINRFRAVAKAKGRDHPYSYLYQNYAALQQDVANSNEGINGKEVKQTTR